MTEKDYDANVVIMAHEKLVDEFAELLSEEDAYYGSWEILIKKPNAWLALAAAMRRYNHDDENHVAYVFIETLQSAIKELELLAEKAPRAISGVTVDHPIE